ncbi:MAG: TetR/AcrR family transcriptional regulator [Magnetococcales bacterium]|nr:TetR/AcrR family transcriptional regulator [Magnetococcales bacterium]
MARRTDHSRDELFDLVLNASQQIIELEGVSALTARRIASRIGYSPGTLYNLFDNIDEIVLHLNARTLDDLYQQIFEKVDQSTGRAKLDRMITAYLQFTQPTNQRWNLLFEHRHPNNQTLPDWYQERLVRLLDLIATILQSLLPGCGEREINHSARVLWCSLHGICSQAGENHLDGVNARTKDEMARSLIYNYVSGLKRAG